MLAMNYGTSERTHTSKTNKFPSSSLLGMRDLAEELAIVTLLVLPGLLLPLLVLPRLLLPLLVLPRQSPALLLLEMEEAVHLLLLLMGTASHLFRNSGLFRWSVLCLRHMCTGGYGLCLWVCLSTISGLSLSRLLVVGGL